MNTRSFILAAGFVLATVSTLSCSDDVNDNSGGDKCAGGTYKSVTIGSQVWMAENLNCDVADSKCYDDDPANCTKYGRLYTWEAAVTACPSGWHLPTNAEWDVLYRFADGTNGTESPYDSPTAGKYLKAVNGWNEDGNGLDKYGFAALPGGIGLPYGSFSNIGFGYWWSTSESNDGFAYSRRMIYDEEYANWDIDDKTFLFSVRCLQD